MKMKLMSFLIATTVGLLPTAAAQGTSPAATPAKPAAAPAATPAKPQAQTPTIVSSTVSGQWEYLVISFGKTFFSSAVDLEAKKTGQSKLMIYGPLGGVIASEALDTQAQVDTLGKYGWELIGVLGAIGGDQQWVFKRPFDAARAATEAAQIRREGAELAAAREKAAREEAAKPAAAPAPITELVNLDAREAEAKRNADNQAVRQRFTAAVQLPGWTMAKVDASGLEASTTYQGEPTTQGSIRVMLDVTQQALNGNTYRSSAVGNLVQDYVKALQSNGRFKSVVKSYYCSSGAELKVGASIKFGGEVRDVQYAETYCVQ